MKLNLVAGMSVAGTFLAASIIGCTAPDVDFAKIQPPPRAAELAAYDVFVGSWDWQAKRVTAKGEEDAWTGTATWQWTLDDRCLQGDLSAKGEHSDFKSHGVWTRNPKTKKYSWWLANSWGYPQHGTAAYNDQTKTWKMPYKCTGLDGTASHGAYIIKIVDNNTLDWTLTEWADATHLVKKLEMTGTYKRKS